MKKIVLIIGIVFGFIGIGKAQTKVQVQIVGDFSQPALKATLDSAIILIEKVVNSQLFEDKINKTKFLRKQHKTQSQILNLIRTGHEYGTQSDGIINLKVNVYDTKKNEIGHTDSNDVIHTYKEYILKNGARCYASHLLHEYCHVLGFKHAGWRLPFRSKAVPYRIGKIASEILNANALNYTIN